MTDDRAGSSRDQTAFLAGELGRAKTDSEETGHQLVTQFRQVENMIEKLAEQGISIGTVSFEDTVTQAAWVAHRGARGPMDVPMMPLEDELVLLKGVV